MHSATPTATPNSKPNAVPPTADVRKHWSILAACCLTSSALLLHPPLWVFDPPGVQPFDAAWSDFRLVASISGVLLICFTLIGGVLGDLHGRRRLWLIGLGGFIAANLLLMLTSSSGWHIVVRFLALAFGSIFMPMVLATLNVTFPSTSRAMAFAIYVTINAAALQVGWLQGQFLFDWMGWRATYLLPILFALFAIHWIKRYVPVVQANPLRHPDNLVHSGWTLLVLAVIYGITVLPVASERWWMVVSAASLVGIVGISFILWWDMHKQRHQFEANELGAHTFRARDLTAMIVTGAAINFLVLGFGMRTLGLFQVVKSMSAVVAVIALAPILLGSIAAVYLLSQAVRRYRANIVIASGLLVMAFAIAVSALLPVDAAYWFFVPTLFVFGIGYLLATTMWTSVFLRTVVARNYGVNAAINSATTSIGMAIGSALTGNLLAYIGLELYLQTLNAAQVNPFEALEALIGFKTLVLAEPTDTSMVTEHFGFALMDGYREAYAAAYSQVLWLMVLVCIVTALIIGYGLRGSVHDRMQPAAGEELHVT